MGQVITATFGPVEFRNFGCPDEEVLTYRNPNIRLRNTPPLSSLSV